MCKDVKITPKQLTKAMEAEYPQLVEQVEDAVNQAPDGAVISGSEDSPNAEGIMALAAMDQSGQWQSYWNLQNAVAA